MSEIIVAISERNRARLFLSNQRPALSRRTSSRISNGQKRKHGTHDDCPVASWRAVQGITVAVGVVTYSRSNEVGAVGSNHAGLCETRTRVGLLNRGVDAYESDEDAQGEVERNEELVECAASACEKDVEEYGEDDRRGVETDSGTDEEELPEPRVIGCRVDVVEAGFGPRVGKVDKEDEAEDDEKCSANERKVVAPKDEKAVGNSE